MHFKNFICEPPTEVAGYGHVITGYKGYKRLQAKHTRVQPRCGPLATTLLQKPQNVMF